MKPARRQNTRLNAVGVGLMRGMLGRLTTDWRSASLALLSLLVGFYTGQNLPTALLLSFPGGRPALVLTMVLLIEAVIRIRSRMVLSRPDLRWVIVDNLRLGLVYAIVLEAFKLGT